MEVECNLRSKENVMEHKKGSLNDLNSSLLAKVHGHCLIHKLRLQEFHCLNFFFGLLLCREFCKYDCTVYWN